jgi:hypothetical protein
VWLPIQIDELIEWHLFVLMCFNAKEFQLRLLPVSGHTLGANYTHALNNSVYWVRESYNIDVKSIQQHKTLWPESASELYRPSDRRLSAKLVPTFTDRGCHKVSVMVPYGRILRFIDTTFYFK